jgi:hypothetical protein
LLSICSLAVDKNGIRMMNANADEKVLQMCDIYRERLGKKML